MLMTPIRILFVEDSIPDVEEMLYILKCDGLQVDWRRVDELVDLQEALAKEEWDVVLCDHQLPGFGSLEALRIWKASGLDIPFIIVSGVVDEDTAVVAMKSGACDFLKKDRLSRLSPAIERELQERKNRQNHATTQNELHESEERFRLMMEAMQDYAVFMLDAEGFIISWNSGAQRIFGYSLQEAVGLPLSALYPADASLQEDTAEKALMKALSTGHYEEESLRVRQDGSNFWVHAVMLPLRGADGQLKGFCRITRDIDQRKRADEALKKARMEADAQALARKKAELEKAEVEVERKNLKNLFQQSSTIVAIMSGPKHIVEFSNPAFLRLMGEDCIEKPLEWAQPQLHELLPLLDSVYANGVTEHAREIVLNGQQGTRVYDFVVSTKRNGMGVIDGVMLLGSDVTEQLHARQAAEASSASKSAFLANMSHEIRTPLGAILGFSELLKDANLGADERERYIETINRNSHALTQIIDDILDMAKIEAGRLDVEEIHFSMVELMADVVELFKEKAKQKGIYLTLKMDSDVPSTICSDPTRLRQILFNIIGNAIKFTDVGGVSIHVRLLQMQEGTLRLGIDVKDTGRGLSESQRQRLFQPFTQADNTTTRQFGGTGLGLALSKRLCEALGGSISIGETELAKGSVFTIKFLASKASHAVPSYSSATSYMPHHKDEPRLKDLKVLVVDDVPDNQFLMKRFLTKNGAQVEIASDGSEAVTKALAANFDLVLMDIQMPIMDGYQAIKALNASGFQTPIIALTAHALLEERVRTKAAGFAGHLTKPFNKDELLDTVLRYARHVDGLSGAAELNFHA